MHDDPTVKQQMTEMTKLKRGSMLHIILLIAIISGISLALILIPLYLWWGGFYAVFACVAVSIASAGISHQMGIGRGYQLAKPLHKVSLDQEQW